MVTVSSFRIVETPCEFFTKAESRTRKKKSAKTYEIVLNLENGDTARDCMSWIGAGAGRDCFKLKDHDMCVKWFFEVDKEEWKSLHPKEKDGYERYRNTPVGVHLPIVHAICKQEVQDNWQETMQVDCILVDFVGDSLHNILQVYNLSWNEDSSAPQVLRKLFLAMMVMCKNACSSDLEWHDDLHTGNLCFHRATKRWYFVDLEAYNRRTTGFEVAIHKVAKRQMSEIAGLCKGPDEQWPAYMQWKSMLTEHMMHKHNQWIQLKDVATKLQVELGPIEAGSMSVLLSSMYMLLSSSLLKLLSQGIVSICRAGQRHAGSSDVCFSAPAVMTRFCVSLPSLIAGCPRNGCEFA